MRKSTWAAGCIAGVVAACTGAGLEAVGDTMADAGRAIAGAGGALVAAGVGGGDALATAGRALAGAGGALAGRGGSAGSSSAAAQSIGDGLPNPRWVLRDKSGTPVRAMMFSVAQNPSTAKRFAAFTPSCALINFVDAKAIGLAYDLKSGKIAQYPDCPVAPSFATAANWRDTPVASRVIYADAACSGQRYVWKDDTLWVGNTLYVGSTELLPSTTTALYVWNTTKQACEATSADVIAASSSYSKVTAMPADIVNLLPNAPYTLELAY